MLGALHKAMVSLDLEAWYSSRMNGLEGRIFCSVAQVETILEKVVRDAIDMVAGGREETSNLESRFAHAQCRPWVPEDLYKFKALPEVRGLVIDHAEHLKRQAEKSGLDPTLSL
jgi:hypothetical protein